MAGIKIDPEMLDIYMELLNKLMAGSETDGGNARLEVSGAGKTEEDRKSTRLNSSHNA